MIHVLIKMGNLESDTCIKIKIEVIFLEAKPRHTKDVSKPPETMGEAWARPSLTASEGDHLASPALLRDFWPPGLRDNKF